MSGPGPSGTARLSTAADTVAFGAKLARQLRAGDVVILSGGLGAGKTTLTQGIARGLAVDGPVTSPTYVLARVHPSRTTDGPDLVHVDLYRLRGYGDDAGERPGSASLLDELDALDLDTDLDGAVVVVEWGAGLAERLSERHLHIRLSRAENSADSDAPETRTLTWRWSAP